MAKSIKTIEFEHWLQMPYNADVREKTDLVDCPMCLFDEYCGYCDDDNFELPENYALFLESKARDMKAASRHGIKIERVTLPPVDKATAHQIGFQDINTDEGWRCVDISPETSHPLVVDIHKMIKQVETNLEHVKGEWCNSIRYLFKGKKYTPFGATEYIKNQNYVGWLSAFVAVLYNDSFDQLYGEKGALMNDSWAVYNCNT